MTDIPNSLQCSYCVRSKLHGGECNQKIYSNEKSCLIFNLDKKGCIRNKDFQISIPLFYEIPLLNVWNDDFQIDGIDTEIKIKHIYGLSWDKTNRFLIIHCNIDYYVNEFLYNYKDNNFKFLKVIK